MTTQAPESDKQFDIATLIVAGTALVVIALLCWAVATATALLGSGRGSGLSLVRAATAAVRLITDGDWGSPRDAYPTAAARRMPAAALWWTTAGTVLTATATGIAMLFVRVEPQIARARLARRPGDIRGSRPRSWARPRDLIDSHPDGFTIGRLDRRVISTPEEAHVCLIAPTRAGKTTRYVIPWLLEHQGPAIITSTKTDILDATRDHRAKHGALWVFDPFGPESCSWDALHGCADWSTALRQAHWLAEATQQGDSELAGYWRGEAAKLLAPLLHAAADTADISTVLAWVDQQDPVAAARGLLAKQAVAAERQLQAVRGLDDRNRGTTFMSAGSVLAAYRYPEVLSHAFTPDLTAENLLDGEPNTLYVVAAERHQRLLEPVLGALLSSIIHAAIEREADTPRLRILLDEAANIAPLRDLPRLMSQAAGHGIRIATVWQSLAQLQERYDHGAHTILANSAAKLVMGSTTDQATRRYAESLLDQDDDTVAAALQHLEHGRALYVNSTGLPAVVNTAPYWNRWPRADTPTAPRGAE